jgi:hypothetical protein
MKKRTVVWEPVEYKGMEYLQLWQRDQSVEVESVVLGIEDRMAFRLNYRLLCDGQFSIQGFSVESAGQEPLDLITDGRGNWSNVEGHRLPQFTGCIDIDITATPFTNTLPIRRVHWEVGQIQEFKMLYITVPELMLSVSPQRYTCLEKMEEGALFYFEVLDTGFTAELPVDAEGLVLDYPGLFKRLWSSSS